ncbi:MAG: hypothetical protein ACE5IZ_01675, partial [Dehalococcoidia bacterium]
SAPPTAVPEPATPSPAVTPRATAPAPTPVGASPSAAPVVPTVPPHATDRDLIDLAPRLGRLDGPAPRLAREEPPSYEEGQRQRFWVLDVASPSVGSVEAILRLVSPHAYFYVEDGAPVTQEDLEEAARAFEEEVYPQVTAAFGREWSPGVDSDPRIAIVHARVPGLGGYFTDQDEYPRSVAPYSNEREAIYLNVQAVRPGSAAYKDVLAHEFQHLVHWNADPSEEAWVNEGLSEVASELLGGGMAVIPVFLRSPDLQLTSWETLSGTTAGHYGASHLFFRYLLERYGGIESAQRLAAEAADGVEGIDDYLRNGGFGATFEDVFADWVVANYLDDGSSGPYDHTGSVALRARPTAVIDAFQEGEGAVHQFAADYLAVALPAGDAVFTFDGASAVPVIATAARSGRGMWWSGRGDAIDHSLTAAFDLRPLASATLRFWTWYDIEEGWDYGYVLASTDGGHTWQPLPGRHSTDANPVGQAYGPGYTGKSGDGSVAAWVEETVDLAPYAGQQVLIRFEYVTDQATNQPGWAIDDIAVPELGFQDGGETGGVWVAQGFQRLTGPLRQRFLLQLIEVGDEGVTVRRVPLDAANHASIELEGFGDGLQRAVLVVAATTEGTSERATYRYSVGPVAP